MVQKLQEEKFCKPKQIWWANIGDNIGEELNGKGEEFVRPVLIFKRIRFGLCFVIPLTSKDKMNNDLIRFRWKKLNGKQTESSAILMQAKTISTKRLKRKAGVIKQTVFLKIKQHYFQFLFTKNDGTT